MNKKEMCNILKNVVNVLGDIEIKAKYSKTYNDCFDALLVIRNELEKESEVENANNTNQ